jgi:hypothetical protein
LNLRSFRLPAKAKAAPDADLKEDVVEEEEDEGTAAVAEDDKRRSKRKAAAKAEAIDKKVMELLSTPPHVPPTPSSPDEIPPLPSTNAPAGLDFTAAPPLHATCSNSEPSNVAVPHATKRPHLSFPPPFQLSPAYSTTNPQVVTDADGGGDAGGGGQGAQGEGEGTGPVRLGGRLDRLASRCWKSSTLAV